MDLFDLAIDLLKFEPLTGLLKSRWPKVDYKSPPLRVRPLPIKASLFDPIVKFR